VDDFVGIQHDDEIVAEVMPNFELCTEVFVPDFPGVFGRGRSSGSEDGTLLRICCEGAVGGVIADAIGCDDGDDLILFGSEMDVAPSSHLLGILAQIGDT
jgi:hypothetical protein